MKAISVKLPQSLATWLTNTAAALGRTRSDLVQEALQRSRKGQNRVNCHHVFADVCGVIDGPKNLSANPKQMNRRMSKETQLRVLARKRKRARWEGFKQVADYHAEYDSDYVSPFTKSAHNVESKILVMLQDWSSHNELSKPLCEDVQRYGYNPRLPTNKNLILLLRRHFQLELGEIYATNLFPFIKPDKLSGKIPNDALVRAAKEYALEQVHIVQPALVICLGKATSNALRQACGLPIAKDVNTAIATQFEHDGALFWTQAHPGHYGQVGRNRVDPGQVYKDWQQMRSAFGKAT